MKWWVILLTAWLVGCATFEQTPGDVQQKLSDPLGGHLYVPEPDPGH